ncbi:MAG: energy-coupling factor transporter transmembrane component T [Nitrososphaerota archaeon]|nr:energy-coupling factor transporter transmembrane protein EcfT [Aigarchaeota archaeon]MDW8076832.1 energy-coupling factor transporter transmembrane component T [Nitrososphaerota archaeon]
MPKLDCRSKLVFFFSIMALTFICKDFWCMLALLATAFVIVIMKGFSLLSKSLRMTIPMVVVAFVVWSMLHNWSLFQSGGAGLDWQLGGFMAMRLFTILMISAGFLATVKPGDLMKGLSLFGIPYGVVFTTGLALRHVYTVADDYHAVKEALSSRGLEFDKGPLNKRIRNYVFVLTPLLIRSIENAEKLVLAMKLKVFSLGRRRRRSEKLGPLDMLLMVSSLVAVVLAILHYWVGII